jgi:signal transduction histidine kinase
MNYLIGNLMDMVGFESGKLRVELSALDFLTVFQELKTTFAPVAANKKILMEWNLPENQIPILGDFNRLIQVLTNLISNAIKHTPENGKIRVSVSIKQGTPAKMVLTEIKDTGEGISPENQPRVFEQFYQVETSPTRRQGLGLGLTIAQEIIHTHNGEIGVFSEGLGKGSTFYFTLPIQ